MVWIMTTGIFLSLLKIDSANIHEDFVRIGSAPLVQIVFLGFAVYKATAPMEQLII
jgi:hypothetical protein